MRYHHIILLASNCSSNLLVNTANIKQLVDKLSPSGILEKNIVRRKNGVVAFVITDFEHIIFTTNPLAGQAFLEIRSQRPVDTNKFIQALQQIGVPLENISYREFADDDYQNMECQEPRCSRLATKDHNGFKVCQDHYEVWLEKEEKRDELKDYT